MYIPSLKCEICDHGRLYFDFIESVETLSDEEVVDYKYIDEYIENTLNNFLIYRCDMCDSVFKYTYKDIEKIYRSYVMEKVAEVAVVNNMLEVQGETYKRTLIYCGKCKGQDGKGSCTTAVYNICDLKELPVE